MNKELGAIRERINNKSYSHWYGAEDIKVLIAEIDRLQAERDIWINTTEEIFELNYCQPCDFYAKCTKNFTDCDKFIWRGRSTGDE